MAVGAPDWQTVEPILRFDGPFSEDDPTNLLDLGGYDTVVGAEGFSLMATVCMRELRPWARIFSFCSGLETEAIMAGAAEETINLHFTITHSPDELYPVSVTNALELGKESRFLFTVSSSGHMRVYVDGCSVGENDGVCPNAVHRPYLNVGCHHEYVGQGFCGSIANVVVWNQEVAWLPDCDVACAASPPANTEDATEASATAAPTGAEEPVLSEVEAPSPVDADVGQAGEPGNCSELPIAEQAVVAGGASTPISAEEYQSLLGTWTYGQGRGYTLLEQDGWVFFSEESKSGCRNEGYLYAAEDSWFECELMSNDRKVGTIRVKQTDDMLISKFRGLLTMEWGADKVARRKQAAAAGTDEVQQDSQNAEARRRQLEQHLEEQRLELERLQAKAAISAQEFEQQKEAARVTAEDRELRLLEQESEQYLLDSALQVEDARLEHQRRGMVKLQHLLRQQLLQQQRLHGLTEECREMTLDDTQCPPEDGEAPSEREEDRDDDDGGVWDLDWSAVGTPKGDKADAALKESFRVSTQAPDDPAAA